MTSYGALAHWYDAFTADVPYESFADFYEALFREDGGEFELVLDLCCGTGTLALIMAARGYDMLASDASGFMLMEAGEKLIERDVHNLLLLNQPAGGLDLYGMVDAVYSSLDSLNYVPFEELLECFRRLRLFIRPGGLLIFDLRTPEFLRSMDGSVSVDETEGALCLWRGSYDGALGALRYGMDIFELTDTELYERREEEHLEYAHDPAAVMAALEENGFVEVRTRPEGPMAGPDRVFIQARRGFD